jgi:hypothetical protein
MGTSTSQTPLLHFNGFSTMARRWHVTTRRISVAMVW